MSPARPAVIQAAPRSCVALALLTVCILTAACGAAPVAMTATAPTATATPLGGTPLVTAKFTTVVPNGWTNRINDSAEVQRFSVSGQVELLLEQVSTGQFQAGAGGVTADVNVVLLSDPVPDDQLSTYLQSVTTSGATNLSTAVPFTIDGATGQSITYDRDIQGIPGETREMMVNRGGNTFDIVLNTAQASFGEQLAGLQAVLAAWRWTG